MKRVRRHLAGHGDGDRQMVGLLAEVAIVGLEDVEAACAEALAGSPVSRDVVVNILTWQRAPLAPANISTPDALRLRHEPAADSARYDCLRRYHRTPGHIGGD
jgi:hypothetical protein